MNPITQQDHPILPPEIKPNPDQKPLIPAKPEKPEPLEPQKPDMPEYPPEIIPVHEPPEIHPKL